MNSFGLGGTAGVYAWTVVVVAGSSAVVGLARKERWVCVLAILGISLWFFAAWCLLGLSA
jgi:hypothetical protein